MKNPVVTLVAWSFVLAVVVYACLHPDHGVLYDNPLACLGVGLVGLGMCVEARKRMQAQPADESR